MLLLHGFASNGEPRKVVVTQILIVNLSIRLPEKKSVQHGKKIANSTRCSQAVTHPSTNRVQHFLTSVTERGLVQQHGITVNRKFKSKNSLQFALWLPRDATTWATMRHHRYFVKNPEN
uniref:Uncharacterized protein n=1 Tax=Vespula pensylvanica TaxID=30213 RepID=A0A834KTP7_VESPE|nr:hypothetical protein H0235_013711 [Vespula pensylvanica]